jgi:phospholipid transport system substrate-binding protein
MNMMRPQFLLFSFFCFCLLLGSVARATESLSAQMMVEQTTDRVVALIDDARTYIDENPERFYKEVDVILDEVVDFNSFARGVMGKYASKEAYLALKTKEEKKQFIERVKRFSAVFKDGLVQTYAKGLLSFNGQRIQVVPDATEASSNGNSATVVQHIYGDKEVPYVILYKLRKNKAGDWKLRNVTIEAINLGKIYQSQFYSAMKQYEGDIDKVIDTWSVEPGQGDAVDA